MDTMARSTRAARRGIRRGPRRSAHALLTLLLTVLAATAITCGLARPAQAFSTVSAHPVAMTGDMRSASAVGHAGDGGCRPAAGSAAVSLYEDCDQAHCTQASGQPHPSCCDIPNPNGAFSTSSAVVSPPTSGAALAAPSAAYQPRCPDTVESGPGPPDLHMLQLLRV
ncbi:hypothetical protein [Streptomyces canus]|uniref:hypothetical protein n=1 Tax=Streptomyces canus TaxID=58343 RepID=UPI0036E38F65